MARKTGLGRGLGAIFGTDVVESVEESLHQPEKKEENHVSRETSPPVSGLTGISLYTPCYVSRETFREKVAVNSRFFAGIP